MRSTPALLAIGVALALTASAGLALALVATKTAFAHQPQSPDPSQSASAPTTAPAAAAPSTPQDSVNYDRDIRPLLSDRCFKCHGPDASSRKAGLRLDLFDPATDNTNGPAAIVPGDIDASELWKRINSTDPDEQMPPPTSNKKPTTPQDRELIRKWIITGATYQPHWSFVPPKHSPAPNVSNPAWCKNDVDRFILGKLDAEKITPSPEAEPQTLVRRVFLDLTGLPPTPEETDAYLADVRTDRYERLVDMLLTQEPYRSRTAERMAIPWLDAARYADTAGIHTDNGRQIWPWRDWVLAAFRDNIPYDRFVIEQLAGDLLPNATIEQKVASGFNRNHVTTDEGGAIPEEYLVEYAVDRASTTASALLGLTMGCARCHDHKFDPITHEDFYSFYAFFNSIDEPGLYSQTPDANRAHEPFLEVPTPQQRSQLAVLEKERSDLKQQQAITTTQEDADYAAFATGFPKESGLAWSTTQIISATSQNGATLSPQPDGSILASGKNPATDVHEITLRATSLDSSSAGLRMLMLEALEHESLPGGHIGRAGNGNAVLSAIEIESFPRQTSDQPAPAEQIRRHQVQWLWADVSQTDGDYRFTNLLVANKGSDRGWAVDGHRKPGPRRLLVLLSDPIPRDSQTDVRIRLRYETIYSEHVLGRVRISLGTMTDAAKLPLELSNFWLAGPFPSDVTKSSYNNTFGPETVPTIDFAQNFGSGNQTWRFDANLTDGAVVPLAVGTNVTFLGRIIVSPTDRDLPVSLSSDDGFVLFVNGKEIARREIERSAEPDSDRATLPLKAGQNIVILKIINTGGLSAYYFKPQISEVDGAYPHELVGALLPESSRSAAGDEQIKQAWRASRSPDYRQRKSRIEATERELALLRTKVPKTMVMKELATPRPTFVLSRGQYDQPDKTKPVSRRVPVALGAMPPNAPANRLGLAQWMVSPENPLTSRVAVNRIWEIIFGFGIVRTSEDFGFQGEWPSHPELLDTLAADFRDNGWNTRQTLRLIVTSATYRQSSTPRPELHERDPDNRLLARAPRRRLPAEHIRDQALYVSGLLIEGFGGPSVKPYQPEGLWQEGALPGSNTKAYERGKGDDLYRRSLYTYWKRAVPPPDLQAFDAPTREFCTVLRPVTSTPLQALVLWNNPQFVEASRVLAQRTLAFGGELSGELGGQDQARLTNMFRRVTGQSPTQGELATLQRSLSSFRTRFAAAADDAAKLLSVGDKPLPENADKPELASWTMTAAAIMNLYRTTTQQ